MAKVVPTVLAATPEEFATRLERASSLSARVHIDVTDGRFTPGQTISLAQVHTSPEIELDLHLMISQPEAQLETALSLHPKLIIFHAEAETNLPELIQRTQELGVRAGVALLPETTVDSKRELIKGADHVLIFTGRLGYNGGEFQAEQLAKVADLRALKSDIEISVDGGVNDRNAAQIVAAGVDVLYVGGFLQDAVDPRQAYATLGAAVEVSA